MDGFVGDKGAVAAFVKRETAPKQDARIEVVRPLVEVEGADPERLRLAHESIDAGQAPR